MADQTNEDSKTPIARRGARPFGGPSSSSAPSRPFIRPPTPHRPTAAPFVAPVAPGKLVLRNAAPPPAAKAPTPVAPPLIPPGEIVATSVPAIPGTSELVALDAIDAFDAVWGVSETPGRPTEPAAVASPLDELSLGSGTDGQQLWAEDITANDLPAGEQETVAPPVARESSATAPASTTPAWLDDDAAPPPVPSQTVADSKSPPAVSDVLSPLTAVAPVADVEGLYGLGEWTDTHTIPASDEIMGVSPKQPVAAAIEPLGDPLPAIGEGTGEAHDVPEPHLHFELVETPREEPQPELHQEDAQVAALTTAPTAPAFAPHEARIAATFDRLADRVRSGEIDVSSIAPDATDAAVVASVLAALLGGSRSR